ncbi:MAG: MFS transporter [Ardenticatenaceae bacterium]|nr:MFS transporter [Anaerolineales bacterium]MCB8923616.1 MFS transporter [Ardenticatenaceae bacterium]
MKSDVIQAESALPDVTVVETAVPTPTDTFQTDQVLTIAGAHFAHDTFSAFLAPLLPLLQERLNTNYALTGGLTIYSQLPSLLNPFIGYLADKVSLRYFIIFAPAVTATLMSSMGFTSNYLTLALLLLAAGVSIAAFHAPAPAMVGRISGKQVGKGMSIFMASGELGRTLGPVIAVAAVNQWALEGIWRLAFVGWAVSGILYWRLHNISVRPVRKEQAALSAFWPKARRLFSILTWIMLARVFMLVSVTTYLPIFMRDVRQTNLWLAAASLTILEGAGVVGALLTGTLSDRLGRRQMLTLLLGVAPLLLMAFLYGPTWLLIPLLLGLGLTAITTQPVLLAVVQDEFPQHRALANGTFLGISFLVRAGAVWIVGMWADQFGLTQAFLWSGLAAWVSLPAIWLLPQRVKVG